MPRKTGGGNDRVRVMGEGTMGCGILKMAVNKNGGMWDPQGREKK